MNDRQELGKSSRRAMSLLLFLGWHQFKLDCYELKMSVTVPMVIIKKISLQMQIPSSSIR